MRSAPRRTGRGWILLAMVLSVPLPSLARPAEKDYGSILVCPDCVKAVADGDTFAVDIPGWPAIIGENLSVRIVGIDTPERKDPDPAIRAMADKARVELVVRLRNAKKIELQQLRRDKYFRVDARVVVDGQDLASLLVAAGVAKPWDGSGPRPAWRASDAADTR